MRKNEKPLVVLPSYEQEAEVELVDELVIKARSANEPVPEEVTDDDEDSYHENKDD